MRPFACLVLLLGCQVGGLSAAAAPSAAERDDDVLIIGAGVSGLATARTLLDSNPSLRVIILEAREPSLLQLPSHTRAK